MSCEQQINEQEIDMRAKVLDTLSEVLKEIQNVIAENPNNLLSSPEYYTTFSNLLQMASMLSTPVLPVNIEIFFISFLYHVDKNPSHIEKMVNLLLDDKKMPPTTRFFYYWQMISLAFTNPKTPSQVNEKTKQIYSEIVNSFKEEMALSESHIPEKERIKEIVFVITSQFLNLNHAPTKTVLDRAYALAKHFDKKVVIINTADLLTAEGEDCFFLPSLGSYIPEYSNGASIAFKDENFGLRQCPQNMPNVNSIKEIFELVKKYRPYFILNIGGNNITSDLCSLFVPTISLATVFSGLPNTCGTFKVTANPKLCTEDNILTAPFTFDYKPQTHTYTREELSFPVDKFLILVSGGRLTEEVTYDFLNEIREIFKYNTHIIFAGIFNNYNKIIADDEELKNNTTFIGFQEDMLAISEVCDLYINPPRNGGGSSIAEAFSKGKPGITLSFGDCSIAAGEDFCVETLSEMKDLIIKYVTDKEFYKVMSEKAIERNEILTNTKIPMAQIIEQAKSSKYWW